MSMLQFYTYLGNLCGGADLDELDDRLLCDSIMDTGLQHLRSMMECAMNPQGLPIALWHRGDPGAETIAGTHVVINATLENKLAATRAALMRALPAMSPDAVTRVTMALAARCMCNEPWTLMRYLEQVLQGRTGPAWIITEDERPVSIALMRMGVLPAPHLLDIDRLTNYVSLANLDDPTLSAFSVRTVIEFIITALTAADATIFPYSCEPVSVDVQLLCSVGVIRSRGEGISAQVHAATRSFIHEAYPDASASQLDAFAKACVQQRVRHTAYLRGALSNGGY